MLLFCKQINTSSKSCYSARCGTGHLPYKLLSHRSVKRIACRTMTMRARRTVVLEEYRKHVAERAAEGIAPKPLDANQMAALVERSIDRSRAGGRSPEHHSSAGAGKAHDGDCDARNELCPGCCGPGDFYGPGADSRAGGSKSVIC